jgi:hypothetical protein
MKKTIATTALILALVAGATGVAATASAHPSKTKPCSACHHTSTAVKITVSKVSATATTVKYKVSVTGGKGSTGWAVLAGASNVARKSASTGVFTVKKGKTYKIWAVKTGSGANSKSMVAK